MFLVTWEPPKVDAESIVTALSSYDGSLAFLRFGEPWVVSNEWPGVIANVVLFFQYYNDIIVFTRTFQYFPLFPQSCDDGCCICRGNFDYWCKWTLTAAYHSSQYQYYSNFSLAFGRLKCFKKIIHCIRLFTFLTPQALIYSINFFRSVAPFQMLTYSNTKIPQGYLPQQLADHVEVFCSLPSPIFNIQLRPIWAIFACHPEEFSQTFSCHEMSNCIRGKRFCHWEVQATRTWFDIWNQIWNVCDHCLWMH